MVEEEGYKNLKRVFINLFVEKYTNYRDISKDEILKNQFSRMDFLFFLKSNLSKSDGDDTSKEFLERYIKEIEDNDNSSDSDPKLTKFEV